MDSYKETNDTWNKVAILYQDKFMDLDLYNYSYDIFCGLLAKQNSKILEIGCGPGNISKYLSSKRDDLVIEGIDYSPNMIDLARKNIPAAKFQVLDVRQIEILEGKFDGIVCGFCIPYISRSECSKL